MDAVKGVFERHFVVLEQLTNSEQTKRDRNRVQGAWFSRAVSVPDGGLPWTRKGSFKRKPSWLDFISALLVQYHHSLTWSHSISASPTRDCRLSAPRRLKSIARCLRPIAEPLVHLLFLRPETRETHPLALSLTHACEDAYTYTHNSALHNEDSTSPHRTRHVASP